MNEETKRELEQLGSIILVLEGDLENQDGSSPVEKVCLVLEHVRERIEKINEQIACI